MKGVVYRRPHQIGGGTIMYRGCATDDAERINTTRLFRGMDEEKLPHKEPLQYLSTLYWSPAIMIDGSYNLSFFSSDLVGRYRITAEGVAENGDILYAEKGRN
ncbi:hypothetical protein ABDK00_009370 [Niabella insulamsoli]|uniref:hypothetical protein n=1 Tax=Niabella insulamsoli TaxID=3144874 RepID=UPI0031FCFCA9